MKRHYLVVSVALILLFISACGPEATEAFPSPTLAVEEPTLVLTLPTDEIQVLADTPLPENTEAPVVTATKTPIVITHEDFPENKAAIDWSQEIRDCNTGERVALGVSTIVGSGCDDWAQSKIERPVMSFNETYIPGLDINRAYMGKDGRWNYASIRLHDSAADVLPAELFVVLELDTDIDSRGEYLITASIIGAEWSTDGVQVWHDTNGDVGGNKPVQPDSAIGDGYETLIFDAGLGEDPDLAWARVNPENGSVVEIAFKDDLMPDNGVFAWWVWTTLDGFDPAAMELVDNLDPGDSWRMDNTCGWIFGARPSTTLRNLCEIITPTPTPTLTPTAIQANNPEITSCPYFDFYDGVEYCAKLGYWSHYWDNKKCKCIQIN